MTIDLEEQQNPQRFAAEMQPVARAPPGGGVRILHAQVNIFINFLQFFSYIEKNYFNSNTFEM